MMARIRKSLDENQKGFTLVELLVVVVIIGILAAIAIPAFMRQRESAWRAAVESDLKNASIAAENFSTQNDGEYTGMDAADLAANGYNTTADVTLAVTTATATAYTLTASHANLTGSWVYNSTTGVITP